MTSGKFATTIGYERRCNEALQFDDAEAFAAHMLERRPPRPPNMDEIVARNRGLRPAGAGTPPTVALDAASVAAAAAAGNVVIDVRAAGAFAAGHVPGSLSVDARLPAFEAYVCALTPAGAPLLLASGSAREAADAWRRLAHIGLDARVAGFFTVRAWRRAGFALARLARVEPRRLAEELARGQTELLDVREADEWAAGHVAGARRVGLRDLPEGHARAGLTPGARLAVVCAGGLRSASAVSWLSATGRRDVRTVAGGMQAWRRAGLPESCA